MSADPLAFYNIYTISWETTTSLCLSPWLLQNVGANQHKAKSEKPSLTNLSKFTRATPLPSPNGMEFAFQENNIQQSLKLCAQTSLFGNIFHSFVFYYIYILLFFCYGIQSSIQWAIGRFDLQVLTKPRPAQLQHGVSFIRLLIMH